MTHHDTSNLPLTEQAGRRADRRKPAPSRLFRVAAVAACLPVIGLAGCAKHSKDHFTVSSVKANYKERHPIVLKEQEQTLDVPVGTTIHDLPVASQSAVRGFTNAFKRSASGRITVMLPSGSPNEATARKIGDRISEIISKAGVPANRIATVTYYAAEHGSAAPIRLSYGAVTASVTGCGKWDSDLTKNPENRNYSNFGCATQSNLAAMISNPADLLGPRGTTGIDAARRSKVIEDYRAGEETNTSDNSYVTIEETFSN